MAVNENSRFSLYRGDTKILNIAITDSNGAPVDIDDAMAVTFGLFAVEAPHDAALLRTLDDTIALAGNVITVILPADETAALLGIYLFEVELVDVNGYTFTVLRGEATIHADLIQAVTP